MSQIPSILNYFFAFLSVYIQVFFLISFFERRKDIVIRKDTDLIKLKRYPSVSVIVPCYNEAKTIYGTVRSLLALDYPKSKLRVILVDDGSRDNTWELIQKFTKYPQIEAYQKKMAASTPR